MEGAHPGHPLGHLAQQTPHAQLHLSRGLVGEGHRQNLIRPRLAHPQQMHDPRRQRLGLARPRPGQHQHRTIQRLDRCALRRVQIVQIGRRPRRLQGALRQRHRRRLKGFILIPAIHAPNPSLIRAKGKGSSNVPSAFSAHPAKRPSQLQTMACIFRKICIPRRFPHLRCIAAPLE